ncbi:hypothetical protein N185_17145 [Sinorhizobium sp. GW3]|nr:hypothetical protein N185_17145 [Sinorhizobium sp. GW3]
MASISTSAMVSRFPISRKIVGEEHFFAIAQEFVSKQTPSSPPHSNFGDEFADFVELFYDLIDIAFVPDVMRLEAARSRAYSAADATSITINRLREVQKSDLADVVFVPHPSLSVVKSVHPVVTIWAMHTGEIQSQPILDWQGEDALIIRPQKLVEVHRLSPGGAAFMNAIARGATVAAAAEIALEDAKEFDLADNLAQAFQVGAFGGLST